MTVKQLGFACCQVVQKPFALSFHVPLFFWPDSARGSRVILPSGVNVILNLVPPGVEAVKGSPLKKVAWMLLGAIGSAAKAALAVSRIHATVNGSVSRRRLVCRERSIVRGEEGRIMTRPSSRPEARSRLGCQAANELGAPVASS